MAKQVVMGALLKCSFGSAPVPLGVLPLTKVTCSSQPAATVMDSKPMVNIKSFGPCKSPTFPPTATATAAAMAVLTPMPCLPGTGTPWTPGAATVKIGNMLALDDSSTCLCSFGGTITITSPGQATTKIP